MFKMTDPIRLNPKRFNVTEWDGSPHTVEALYWFELPIDQYEVPTVYVAVQYCDGEIVEINESDFDRGMKAKAADEADPFHHVEGCKCKK